MFPQQEELEWWTDWFQVTWDQHHARSQKALAARHQAALEPHAALEGYLAPDRGQPFAERLRLARAEHVADRTEHPSGPPHQTDGRMERGVILDRAQKEWERYQQRCYESLQHSGDLEAWRLREGPRFFEKWMATVRLHQLFDNLVWTGVSNADRAVEEFPVLHPVVTRVVPKDDTKRALLVKEFSQLEIQTHAEISARIRGCVSSVIDSVMEERDRAQIAASRKGVRVQLEQFRNEIAQKEANFEADQSGIRLYPTIPEQDLIRLVDEEQKRWLGRLHPATPAHSDAARKREFKLSLTQHRKELLGQHPQLTAEAKEFLSPDREKDPLVDSDYWAYNDALYRRDWCRSLSRLVSLWLRYLELFDPTPPQIVEWISLYTERLRWFQTQEAHWQQRCEAHRSRVEGYRKNMCEALLSLDLLTYNLTFISAAEVALDAGGHDWIARVDQLLATKPDVQQIAQCVLLGKKREEQLHVQTPSRLQEFRHKVVHHELVRLRLHSQTASHLLELGAWSDQTPYRPWPAEFEHVRVPKDRAELVNVHVHGVMQVAQGRLLASMSPEDSDAWREPLPLVQQLSRVRGGATLDWYTHRLRAYLTLAALGV